MRRAKTGAKARGRSRCNHVEHGAALNQALGIQMAAQDRKRASRHAGARSDFLKVTERDVELANRAERTSDAPYILAGASQLARTRGLGNDGQDFAQSS